MNMNKKSIKSETIYFVFTVGLDYASFFFLDQMQHIVDLIFFYDQIDDLSIAESHKFFFLILIFVEDPMHWKHFTLRLVIFDSLLFMRIVVLRQIFLEDQFIIFLSFVQLLFFCLVEIV